MASRSNMSLTRHFTKSRRGGSDVTRSSVGSIRNKISAPVELIHTTNLLSYNAPDIASRSASSTTTSSTRSDDDSDLTTPTSASVASSPPTSPDIASKDCAPSPQPNHLSCYFMPPAVAPTKPAPAPIIPQRAPSRTSKHAEITSRQPSLSRFSSLSNKSTSTKASYTFSRSSSTSTATSHSSIAAALKPPPTTPLPPPPVSYTHHNKVSEASLFGRELARVAEIAEDYGVKDRLNPNNAEEKEMKKLGLRKFSAEDYVSEIQSLVSALFAESKPVAPMWI